MIRTILKTEKNSLTIQLPNDLVGKTVEVIAFEIDPANPLTNSEHIDKAKRIEIIEKGLSNYQRDISGFKFNREEANDYD